MLASVAQLVARKSHNLKVPGSIPGGGIFYKVNAAILGCFVSRRSGVRSSQLANFKLLLLLLVLQIIYTHIYAPVAQWIGHPPPKREIPGSSPGGSDFTCS